MFLHFFKIYIYIYVGKQGTHVWIAAVFRESLEGQATFENVESKFKSCIRYGSVEGSTVAHAGQIHFFFGERLEEEKSGRTILKKVAVKVIKYAFFVSAQLTTR